MMGIQEQENALFAEWEKHRPGMVRDGVIDEDEYMKSTPKIVYLLKETNGDLKGYSNDLRKFLFNGGRGKTWNNLARWDYGIRAICKDEAEESLKWDNLPYVDESFRGKQLRLVCAMNTKKHSGGGTANNKEVHTYAEEDGELLRLQRAIYNPDIVICCGVGFPQGNLQKRQTSRGIRYAFSDKAVIIDYVHPGVRCSPNIVFYALMDALQEILGSDDCPVGLRLK